MIYMNPGVDFMKCTLQATNTVAFRTIFRFLKGSAS
jgi:hypothetical protein